MIIVMKAGTPELEVAKLIEELRTSYGVDTNVIRGTELTVIGVIGDTYTIDREHISLNEHVERIMKVQEPYKRANRKFHPDDTVVRVGDGKVGAKELTIIAGPCSVENEAQILSVAERIRKAGAGMLRGGAYKPRTSPYSFQGLKDDGLELLRKAREKTGLPIVSEIVASRDMDRFIELVDVLQVGARNMQNYDLLKEVGRTDKPILLKRGMASTIEEMLMSAEHIMNSGNERVILCERGIRTFETYTRNTLDLSAVPALKKLSHLPVLVDPSHGTGVAAMVLPMSLAAVAAGADGLMIEVHNDPAKALSDGPQSITPDQFDDLMGKVREMAPIVGRTVLP
jgi:3-deoxy-7-phosphoheptulonate synthase